MMDTSVSPYSFSLSTCTFVVEKMFIIDCVISFSRGGVKRHPNLRRPLKLNFVSDLFV